MAILVVDDSPDQRVIVSRMLSRAGFPEVLTANSAEEAFRLLGLHGPPDARPGIDLILMDLVMPGIDGIEACGRIKQYPEFRDVPVLMLTASADTSDLSASFEAGAWDYLGKPVDRLVLVSRVRHGLRLREEIEQRKARERELLQAQRELQEANAALRRLALIDELTGLANRRRFDDYLDTEWRRATRDGQSIGLVLGDIDDFKAFNDTYGHQTGDQCLRRVASAVQAALGRASDLAARYGGEEFATVLPATDAEGAATVAERLRTAIEALEIPHESSRAAHRVTLSLGVAAVVPHPGLTPADLVEAADQALYRAKAAGRNRVHTGLLPDPWILGALIGIQDEERL